MKERVQLRISLMFLLSAVCFTANAQLFDTTGMGTWPMLNNSYTSWMEGAFNANRDTSNPADFGWGEYNMSTHLIEADSVYIIKTVQGDYKAISIDNLASGIYTLSYADLSGASRTIKILDRSNYSAKNFFYYSIDNEVEKDLEPWTDDWDILFTKYPISIPGFGSYPVTGILHNRNVMVSEVHKPKGVAASITDTAQFPFSNDISTIGYNWKTSGPSGTVIHDSITYYVKDQMGNINELKITSYGGSGNGNIGFSVNGVQDSISLNTGNVDQVYYSLENLGSVQLNQDNDWDLALFAQSSFSAIPIRINEVGGGELYVYPNAGFNIWNSVNLAEVPTTNIISVYPNPASSVFHVALQSDFRDEVQLSLINTAGQLVSSRTVSEVQGLSTVQFSTESVEPGVYLLKVQGSNLNAVTRVIVK